MKTHRVHLLPLRGRTTLCGRSTAEVVCDADINAVSCGVCYKAHEKLTEAQEIVPVVFRKDKGEIVAVFPDDGGDGSPDSMGCYAHVGQHSGCSRGWYRTTKPAAPADYESLKRELESDPYEYHFRVLRRLPAWT